MDSTEKTESHLSSAAAFVEGGIQDACDDACSICLEPFCDSDPSTVTDCKHEFHLQCILEWCQRSSQCPMCWQPISLKDPTSQELLAAVEQERSLRFNQPRNATIFHHPTLGDFELQHLPVGTNDAELEERIIQHLAAAAAMGRARHIARRDGHRRSGGQGHPQFLVFSAHPNAPPVGPISASDQRGRESDPLSIITAASPSMAPTGGENALQVPHTSPAVPSSPSHSNVISANRPGNSAGLSTPGSQDRAGPSDFQSFSESLKSRLNAVSMRYKESIAKSTRGWKERFFSRNTSVADLGSDVRREINAGINTVSRMIERLDARENHGAQTPTVSHGVENHGAQTPTVSHGVEACSATESSSMRTVEGHAENIAKDANTSTSVTATSGSN